MTHPTIVKAYRQGLADARKTVQAMKANEVTPAQAAQAQEMLDYLRENQLLETAANIERYLKPGDPREDPSGMGEMSVVHSRFSGLTAGMLKEFASELDHAVVKITIDRIFAMIKEAGKAGRLPHHPTLTSRSKDLMRDAMSILTELVKILNRIAAQKRTG